MATGLATAVKQGLITLGQAQTILIDQANALDLASLPLAAIEEAILEDKRDEEAEREATRKGGSTDDEAEDEAEDDED